MPDRLLTLGRAIALFEGSLTASRYSPRTISDYVRAAQYLVEVHGPDIDPATMKVEDLEVVAARWRTVGATTVHHRMIAWRQFFKWGVRRYGWADPTATLEIPRKDEPVLRRLTMDEIVAIANAALRMRTRDRVVVSTFCYLGIRREEMRRVQWRHVDLEGGTITILGKGRKGRLLPIPPPLSTILLLAREGAAGTHYLAHSIDVKAETWIPKSGIFRPDPTKPCAKQTIDRIIKRCAEDAGVHDPQDVGSHMFRRGLFERLLESGTSPYVVAALAGHSDIKTTAAYGGGASLSAVRAALLRDTTLDKPALGEVGPTGFEPASGPDPSAEPAGSEPEAPLVTPDEASS